VVSAKLLARIGNRIMLLLMKLRNMMEFIAAGAVALPAALSAIDTDADGLDDSVETNTGVYVSPANTGTKPNNPDSDRALPLRCRPDRFARDEHHLGA
jgi:hypothetical protein